MNEVEKAIKCFELMSEKNHDKKAREMAISALDKQVPKKPVRPYESNYKLYYNCPNCGSSGMHDVHKHCWRCGQKLDWGEEGSK